jgi:hypothetical protein
MEHIKFFSDKSSVSKEKIAEYKEKANQCISALHEGTGKGNDFLAGCTCQAALMKLNLLRLKIPLNFAGQL